MHALQSKGPSGASIPLGGGSVARQFTRKGYYGVMFIFGGDCIHGESEYSYTYAYFCTVAWILYTQSHSERHKDLGRTVDTPPAHGSAHGSELYRKWDVF